MYKISNFDVIKNQLRELESQVNDLELSDDIPLLIEKANLTSENDILKKLNDKKSQVLDACFSYVEILEQLVRAPKLGTKKQPNKTKKQISTRKKPRKRISRKNKKVKKITKSKKKV